MKLSDHLVAFIVATTPALSWAQASQGTHIKGNTEINATSNSTIAVATGENSVARNRIGVVQGNQSGNTHITVTTKNVSTISIGRNRKACTNIGGIVSNECK